VFRNDGHGAAWLKGGRNRGSVDKLRLMFNDRRVGAGRSSRRPQPVGEPAAPVVTRP
jgi:hypothetical protein